MLAGTTTGSSAGTVEEATAVRAERTLRATLAGTTNSPITTPETTTRLGTTSNTTYVCRSSIKPQGIDAGGLRIALFGV